MASNEPQRWYRLEGSGIPLDDVAVQLGFDAWLNVVVTRDEAGGFTGLYINGQRVDDEIATPALVAQLTTWAGNPRMTPGRLGALVIEEASGDDE